MTVSFFLRQKSLRNLTEGKCLSIHCSLFSPNNTACFLPGRAKDLSAPPRIYILSIKQFFKYVFLILKQRIYQPNLQKKIAISTEVQANRFSLFRGRLNTRQTTSLLHPYSVIW